jgi:hypothetical protein
MILVSPNQVFVYVKAVLRITHRFYILFNWRSLVCVLVLIQHFIIDALPALGFRPFGGREYVVAVVVL